MERLADEVRATIREASLPPLQKWYLLLFLRNDFVCGYVCHRLTNRLVDEGLVDGGDRWDPESWDWDRILERLLELTDFIVKLVLAIINVLA